MYVQFDAGTDTAILDSPVSALSVPACLQLKYNISSSKIYVQVNAQTSLSQQLQQVALLEYLDQNFTSVWSTTSVPLPDGLTKLQFVAVKIGVTAGDEVVMIDDVTINDGLCPISGLLDNGFLSFLVFR